jgi:hypothetical protein
MPEDEEYRPEQSPGVRLVTQNLLTSAAQYEWRERLTREFLDDLSTLICIFCMYDKIKVLGRDIKSALLSL